MPRGGLRAAANGSLEHLIKPKWKSGATQTIRVPQVLAKQLLDYAHRLDRGDAIVVLQDNKDDLISQANLAKILLERCAYFSEAQEQAISILQTALDLRANAGGAIKAEIRKALNLLEGE